MSNDWYTDEQGRKRNIGGVSNEVFSNRHYYYEKSINNTIPSLFSKYSIDFTKSKLHVTSCPVCYQTVFFCECDNGGKVFFETLSPTWKKHPCTTNYGNNGTVKTYYLIFPKEKINKKVIFQTPEFLKNFNLNFGEKKVHDNLINNCTLLVRKFKTVFLLTILVNNKNFSNEYLCTDEIFYNQSDMEDFIKNVLSNTNLSTSLHIKKSKNVKQKKEK